MIQGVFEWHQRGYLHRDIKPDNVRVNGEGDVVIIDANIAKPISKCAVGMVMWKGKAAGTPGFMDPLVADRVYDWSPAAEVWSLGFMLNDVRHDSRHKCCSAYFFRAAHAWYGRCAVGVFHGQVQVVVQHAWFGRTHDDPGGGREAMSRLLIGSQVSRIQRVCV